mgnify:CR=1 FL=1
MKTIISIIIPIYNAEVFLSECIESVLSQSFKNYELILVNDGSTDNSLNICNHYSKKDSRIRIINGPNGGVSKARNKGINCAFGKWITFIDADDYLLQDALKILYEKALQTDADIILGNSLKLNKGNFNIIHKLENEVTHDVLLSIKHFALWGYLFKSEIISQNKLRFIEGLAYSEDRIFICQIACYSKIIAFCKQPVYVYRINDNSACLSKNGTRKACHHIEASFNLLQLSNKYIICNKRIFKYIHNQGIKTLRAGLYSFIETNFSKEDLYKVRNMFYHRFGKNIRTRIIFYYYLVINYITYKRRKIITIKK